MKNIIIMENVTVNETIERSLIEIDIFFQGHVVKVTSGVRTADDQMQIIARNARRLGIDKEFPEFEMYVGNEPGIKYKTEDFEGYWWHRTWAKLLNIGFIVNPPLPATVLFDYWRPGNPKDDAHNRKGKFIDVSSHQRGWAYDLGGGDNLDEVTIRVLRAKQRNGCHIYSYLKEKVNNAVHVNAVPVPELATEVT
jgi:hypothetical protein